MALLPSKEFEPPVGFHSSALPVVGLSGGDVVAADDLVAEAVAREALAGAVADVVEPGVAGLGRAGRRLDELEVPADVDRVLGDGHRVDAVEVARDPQRLDVGVLDATSALSG